MGEWGLGGQSWLGGVVEDARAVPPRLILRRV